MKNLRFLIALLLFIGLGFSAKADFPNETLNYVITYKWGLVQKDAGLATLTLRRQGADYNIRLTARTKPWADKIFMVRDTLTSIMRMNGMQPIKYIKVSHEGGKRAKDVVDYVRTGNTVLGKCTRYRWNDGKCTVAKSSLSATGPTFDMLSIFYFIRGIDYSKLTAGKVVKATVFSGSKAETIYIRNLGLETVTLRNKQNVKAYHIKFRFTMKGRTESSESMEAWISADSRHIPVELVGQLPVGKVKCFLLNY